MDPGVAAAGVLGLISLGLLIYGDWAWRQNVRGIFPLQDGVMQAKVGLATGHLWLEEMIAGDETVEPDEVWTVLARADQAVGDCLAGTYPIPDLQGGSIPAGKLRGQLEQLQASIGRFRAMAAKRWQNPEAGGVGSAIEQALDQTFHEVNRRADLLDRQAHRSMGRMMAHQKRVHTFTLGLWLVVLIGTCGGLFFVGRTRQRAEEAQRAQHNLLRSIIEGTDDGIFVKDLQGRYVLMNSSNAKGFARPTEEIIGSTDRELLPPELAERIMEIDQQVLASGESKSYEQDFELPEGGARTYWICKYPRFDQAGRVIGVIGVARDVTERKRSEAELREQKTFLADIFASIQDGISILDNELNIIRVNPSMEQWYAHALPLTGKRCYEAYHGRSAPCEVCPTRRTLETGRTAYEVVPKRGPGGEINGWLDLYSFPMFDRATGRVKGVIEYVRDITERQRAEKELAGYREHLEELVQTRTAELEASRERLRNAERVASLGTLAAGLAHEINNPVGSLLLAAENGLKALDSADDLGFARRCFRDVLHEGKRCADVVRSVLQLARQAPVEKWLIDLNEVVRRAVEAAGEYAATHRVLVRHEPADHLPQISGNPVDLERVFANLIRNAVEACRSGGRVTIRSTRSPRAVRVLVQDDGRGLTAEQLKQAFDPFYTTRQVDGGTGLGLSIAHGIITAHGGDIQLESRPDEGTKVLVELPISYLSEGV